MTANEVIQDILTALHDLERIKLVEGGPREQIQEYLAAQKRVLGNLTRFTSEEPEEEASEEEQEGPSGIDEDLDDRIERNRIEIEKLHLMIPRQEPEMELLPEDTFPRHGIVMWSGTIVTIPSGWTLCDGSDDSKGVTTPDLSGKFVVSYESGVYAVGDTGGNDAHGNGANDHTNHTISANNFSATTMPGEKPVISATHSSTDNRPAYYTLAFIWKD